MQSHSHTHSRKIVSIPCLGFVACISKNGQGRVASLPSQPYMNSIATRWERKRYAWERESRGRPNAYRMIPYAPSLRRNIGPSQLVLASKSVREVRRKRQTGRDVPCMHFVRPDRAARYKCYYIQVPCARFPSTRGEVEFEVHVASYRFLPTASRTRHLSLVGLFSRSSYATASSCWTLSRLPGLPRRWSLNCELIRRAAAPPPKF